MENLLPIALLMFIFWFAYYFSTKADREKEERKLESEILKRCPLHKWEFLEQPEFEGTFFVKCLWCHKTPQEISDEIN
jgi:hypothetical protein